MILICYGTRPEWLKLKPIIERLGKEKCYTFFSRQHDLQEENHTPDYREKYYVINPINRLDEIVTNTIENISELLEKVKGINAIMVQGDTASAFAGALAGLHNKIPVIHLEAGLRSFDNYNPYPEESYRKMISTLASVHFAPTETSKRNLKNENITENVYVVGNSILDSLTKYSKDVKYEKTILVTLHRRENHLIYEEWLKEINSLSYKYKNYKFFIFMHPNEELQNKIKKIKWNSNVKIKNPVPHEEFISYLTKTSLVLSDSGGIQEEASFFNKSVIVLRKTTERPEAISDNHFRLCSSPKDLKIHVSAFMEDDIYKEKRLVPCPFGDGTTSEQVYKILENLKYI